jgi:hypothetical protein
MSQLITESSSKIYISTSIINPSQEAPFPEVARHVPRIDRNGKENQKRRRRKRNTGKNRFPPLHPPPSSTYTVIK